MNINTLPLELKELALLRKEEECSKEAFPLDDDVSMMFSWEETPEGDSFWSDVYDGQNIERHNQYAISIVGSTEPNYMIY